MRASFSRINFQSIAAWAGVAVLPLAAGCFNNLDPLVVSDSDGSSTGDPGPVPTTGVSAASVATSTDPTTSDASTTSTTATESGTGTTSIDPGTGSTGTSAEDSSGSSGSSGSGSESTSTGVDLCPFLADEFDGKELNEAWSTTQPENVQVANGELEFINTPDVLDDRAAVRLSTLNLNSALATLELGTLPPTTASQVLFNFFSPTQNSLFFVIQSDDLQIRRGSPGVIASNVFSTPMNPVEHAFLRIDVDTPTVVFEASADGVTWNTLHTETIDWDYGGSTLSISADNFMTLPAAETLSVRSFELCLE